MFHDQMPQVHPARKISAVVDGVFGAIGNNFETTAVEALQLNFDGIKDDYHAGLTRKSGGREPWYERKTEMRNERQLTLVAHDELSLAAKEMGLDKIAPEWIGANLVINGIPNLSFLPASTLLFFEGGVTLKIDFQNAPCRSAGSAIARNLGRDGDVDLALKFKDAAKRRRGLTAWVEKPGTISVGEKVTARIPEQWIYA